MPNDLSFVICLTITLNVDCSTHICEGSHPDLTLHYCCSYIALFYLDWGMWGVGISNIIAVTMAFVAGLILVMILPPQEGKGQIPLLPPEWGGCWQNCCSPGRCSEKIMTNILGIR
jgi:hypothetical protein